MDPLDTQISARERMRSLRRRMIVSMVVLVLALAFGATMLVAGPSRPPVPVVTAPAASPSSTPDVNPIVAENRRPGTTDWRIERGSGASLEGYAGATSVSPGQPVELFVSSSEPTFGVEVYRMGWYAGDGARLVWSKQGIPGVRQDPPVVDPVTNMVEARWQPSVRVPVGTDWVTGSYLAKLVTADGRASYAPFTVRDRPGRKAPVLFQNSVTTWQAYNLWGGHSLYAGVKGGAAERADVVSFDRPYSWGGGAADFIGLELPLLRWLEKQGYDVGYATNVDTHADPSLLTGRKAFLSLGHDEYWSNAMRTHVEAAGEAGVHMAFFGANAVFRAIRLEDGWNGAYRREVNYRSTAGDPKADSEPTVSWRDPPLSRPEDVLLGGTMYECNPVKGDATVYDPLDWLMRGTGLQAGSTIQGIVGSEYDRVFQSPRRPKQQWLLMRAPVNCRGKRSVMDMTFAIRDMGGAGVFDAATSNFLCVFEGCGAKIPEDERVQRMVGNLLDAYLEGLPTLATTPRPFSVGSTSVAPIDDRTNRTVRRSTPAPRRTSVITPSPPAMRTPRLPLRSPRPPSD